MAANEFEAAAVAFTKARQKEIAAQSRAQIDTRVALERAQKACAHALAAKKQQAMILEGQRQMAAEEFAAAVETFKAALALDRSNKEVTAVIQAEIERARKALAAPEQQAMLIEGQRQLAMGGFEAAITTLSKALALDRSNREVKESLNLALSLRGRARLLG